MKDVDAQYYGFRDDDDGMLVPLEIEAEKAAIDEAVSEWKAKREAGEDMEEDGEEVCLFVCLFCLFIFYYYFLLLFFLNFLNFLNFF
jgi:hypothetical protein